MISVGINVGKVPVTDIGVHVAPFASNACAALAN